jgi:large subunit ribosomal protein L10
MHKDKKELVVAELTERLRGSQTLLVADYRGLTMTEIDALRGELLKHGARFSVVKNTLTRRAAEAAGAEALLALLEGPSAIAFLEAGGDPIAAAKALSDAARKTRILTIRGGLLEGRSMSGDEIESLAKLPSADAVRAQVLGAITAPLTLIVGLFAAPVRNLIGLIDARIEQLGGSAGVELPPHAGAPEPAPGAEPEPAPEPEPEAEAETAEPQAGTPEPAAGAEPEPAPEPEAEAETAEPQAAAPAEETPDTDVTETEE